MDIIPRKTLIGIGPAKLKDIIPSIKPILQKIRDTDFRLTDEIELKALKEAKEI